MMEDVAGFTAEDLSLLSRAAVLAGATVALAKYSGGGTKGEFQAILQGLRTAAAHYPGNPLVQALPSPDAEQTAQRMAEQYHSDLRQTEYQDFKMAALNRCASAAELLAQKASPQQAAEVRESILAMCQHVAEASRESGWFSGPRVDVKEAGAIEEIARALALR
jgi:hypothetical protein